MASAMDSGVDTGNDSNDSLAQEKHIIVDMSCENANQWTTSSQLTTAVEKQNSPVEELEQPSSVAEEKIPGPGMSLTQVQPASMMHGYVPSDRDFNYKAHVMFSSPLGAVFVSGGPFGTEFQQHKLVSKVRRRRHLTNCGRNCFDFERNSWKHQGHSCYVNYKKFQDNMRMCRAAQHNNTEAMREMLEAGVSPNCCDSYKRTPLHMAACMGYADMVKLLLEHGADPNAKDSIGNTPLHLAACTNNVNVATLLLRGGTRVAERDKSGHSPLQLAITKFNIMKRSIMPHPVLKEQVCQVINMLTEYMRYEEGSSLDPDMLNKFESLVRVSDSTEEVESNIRDLLSNLSSLSLSNSS